MTGKNVCRVLAVLIAVSFLLPAGMLGNMNFEEKQIDRVKQDFNLYIRGISFDPLTEKPNIPDEWKAPSTGYYIVQFNGPLSSEYKPTIEKMGGNVIEYIPKYAMLVYMGGEVKEKVLSLSFVRCIVNYEAYYKIDPKLMEKTGTVDIIITPFEYVPIDILTRLLKGYEMPRLMDSGNTLKESFFHYKNENMINKNRIDTLPLISLESLGVINTRIDSKLPDGPKIDYLDEVSKELQMKLYRFKLEQVGGTILENSYDNEKLIRVKVDASILSTIAQSSFVKSIDEYRAPRTLSIPVMRTYTGTNTANTNGWNGEGVKVAIMDTGAWVSHEQFGGNVGKYGSLTSTRIFMYRYDGGDGGDKDTEGGHGSWTSSIMVGNVDGTALVNDGDTAYADFEGSANMALLEVQELKDLMDPSTGSVATDGTGTFFQGINDAYLDGCLVHSDSWGSTQDGTYGSSTIDSYIKYYYPTLTVVKAAGNYDSAYADEKYVSTDATGKNILTVGGFIDENTAGTSDDVWVDSASPDRHSVYGPAGASGKIDWVKPDLVVTYNDMKGAYKGGDTTYVTYDGTSGGTPFVAGMVGSVIEMWNAKAFQNAPSGNASHAMIKAILVSTASQMDFSKDSNDRDHCGWGVPSLGNIVDNITPTSTFKLWDVAETPQLSKGDAPWTVSVPSTSARPFKVTLCWLDEAGSSLVNDLDLIVTSAGGTVYHGNDGLYHGTGAGVDGYWSTARSSENDTYKDRKNNVENVWINAPSGDYTITVKAASTYSPQNFALCVVGAPGDSAFLRVDKALYNFGDKTDVTLVDIDENELPTVNDSATVHISSQKDTYGFDLVLNETGVNTNTFTTTVYCSKDSPAWLNDGNSHSAYNIIGLNDNDKITVKYFDTYESGSKTKNVYANATYDNSPPFITDVRVTYVDSTSFTAEFNTNEIACPLIEIALKYNESKYPRDDLGGMTDLDYYLNYYDLASVEDVRNGGEDLGFLPLTTSAYSTQQGLYVVGFPPDSDVVFCVGAFDYAGNYVLDTNGGNYYQVHTVPQPFHILVVDDDTTIMHDASYWIGTGAPYAYLLAMYAGYWPTYKMTNKTGEPVMTDNFGGYNFSKTYNKTTFQGFWDGFVWDTDVNDVPNILIWDTGLTNAHFATAAPTAYNNIAYIFFGLDDAGLTEAECEHPGKLLSPAERNLISDFHNKSGRIAYYGSGLSEETQSLGVTGGSLPSAWASSYMHVTYPTTTGVSVDVTRGAFKKNAGTGALSLVSEAKAYVGFIAQSNGNISEPGEVYNGSVMDDWAMSGDEITAGTGAVNEYKWGENRVPASPSAYYAGVSYNGGAGKAKTFYGSAGMYSWNYYILLPNNPDKPFDAVGWYDKLIKWFASGSVQHINGTAKYSGSPLDNVTVEAFATTDTGMTNSLASGITNATGFYEMKIGPGTYNLTAFKTCYKKNTTRTGFVVTKGVSQSNINFTLVKGVGNISGTVKVVDPWVPETTPSGINVKAKCASPSVEEVTTTGNDGYYYFYDLPAGTYNVTAYDLEYVNASTPYSGTTSVSNTSVVVSTDTVTQNVDFTLESGSISGRVYDGVTNKPLKNAYLMIFKNGTTIDEYHYLRYAFTDEDGTYHFSFLGNCGHDIRVCADGEYWIAPYNETTDTYGEYEPEPYGYSNNTAWNVQVTTPKDTPNINFGMESSLGTIKGTVKNATSAKVISGARVYIELTSPEYMKGYDGTSISVYTDVNGNYSASMPQGNYSLKAGASGYVPGKGTADIIAGSLTTKNFDLTPGEFPTLLMIYFMNDTTNNRTHDTWESSLEAYGYGPDDYDRWYITHGHREGLTISRSYSAENDAKGWPDYEILKGYDVVLLTTEEGFTYDACPEYWGLGADYVKYLETGGSFLLSAQDYPYAISKAGVTALLLNPMHVKVEKQDYATDGTINKTYKGVSGDAISNQWYSSTKPSHAPYQAWEDDIATTDSNATLIFFDNADATRGIGIRYPSDAAVGVTYVSVYLSFSFEGFTSTVVGTPLETAAYADADTNALMANLISFLGKKPCYAPILSGPSVSPKVGSGTFRFSINWTDKDNNTPVLLTLTVDAGKQNEQSYAVTGVVNASDTNYRDGKQYYVDVSGLSQGSHTYNFSGNDTKLKAVGDTIVHEGPTMIDSIVPVVAHTQTIFGKPTGETIQIDATITDNVIVANATLYYTNAGGSTWYTTPMTEAYSQLDPNGYRGTIPAQTGTGTVKYYISASDGTTGNVTNGSAVSPYLMTIVTAIDLITIRNAPNNGGSVVGDVSLNVGDTRVLYAAAYKLPSTYVGDVWCDWSVSATNVAYVNPYENAASSTTKATASGSYIVTATYKGLSDSTGTFTITSGGGGNSPSSAKAAKAADGLSVNLTWENTGATEYLIYRSPYLNGTGFGATPVNKTSNTWYVDSGAYASSSNYSYAVNATGNTTKSNIAFKLCMGIIKPKAPNLNWVSLPYNCPYANIKELAEAVNPGGADANVSEVRYWDSANQLYMIATYDEIEGWGGASYPVTPGMAVMLAAKTTQTWKIVGSHNKSTVIIILKPNAPNLNWVALPYHCSYANIKALAEAVNPGGADANVSEVRYWDAANQLYMIATYDEIEGWGGASYPVTPGMAVMLAAKTTQTWVPAANNP